MSSSVTIILDAGQNLAGVTKSYVDLSVNPKRPTAVAKPPFTAIWVYNADISISCRRVFLPQWRQIEDAVRELLIRFETRRP
jgi:hypothetical protein